MAASGPPAGWYQDPEQPAQQRYWDGASWTEHRQPAPPVSTPPPSIPPPGASPAPAMPGAGAATSSGGGSTALKVLAAVGIGFLLLIGGCVVLVGGAANEVAKDIESAGGDGGGGTGTGGGGGRTVGVGTPLLLKGTQYRVTAATTRASVGPSFLEETAPSGTTYVVVDLELTNRRSDTRTITTEAIKLTTAKGNEYSVDTDASIASAGEGSTLLLEEIQPDVPKSGKVIFAVPQDQVSGAKLRVEDLFSSSQGFISLGL